MNYDEAIAYIESLSPTLGRPGLERFSLFMRDAQKLQDSYPCLHVAGTNGKGSVVCMLAETLMQAGLHTGRYIGPHLMSYNERFEVDGREIANARLAELCSDLRNRSEAFARRYPEYGELTWFELMTAIAFEYFAQEKVQAAVFEVGLGGLYDATNVITAPIATAIVSVSLDHMQILGPTIKDIAFEKAGIIKENIPLLTACTGEALELIVEEAKKKSAPVICVNESLELICASSSSKAQSYRDRLEKLLSQSFSADNPDCSVKDSVCKRKGYQRINAAVAAAVLGIWELQTQKKCLHKFDSALSSYFWPGRMQFFEKEQLILDGAHNEAGARALKESLDKLFPNKERCYILSFYQTKRFQEILSALLKPDDRVFASAAKGRRPVVPAEEVIRQAAELGAKGQPFASLDEAIAAAIKESPAECLKVATGSFATVSAALRHLGFGSVEESRRYSRNF